MIYKIDHPYLKTTSWIWLSSYLDNLIMIMSPKIFSLISTQQKK